MPLGELLGGGEMMFRQLLQHGRDGRVEWIVVFTRGGPMVDEARSLGYETHLLPVGRLRQVGRRWSVIRSIARLARERKVSMIFGWMVASQTMAGPAALLAGVPAAWYQVGLAEPDWLDRLATLFPALASWCFRATAPRRRLVSGRIDRSGWCTPVPPWNGSTPRAPSHQPRRVRHWACRPVAC